MKTQFKGSGKVEISRFKGLGEMMPAQLRDTTMKPGHRTLLRVVLAEEDPGQTSDLVERLMGRKPELRFQFIQENASFATELDI
jgi:topoisomerase-4 subunit B